MTYYNDNDPFCVAWLRELIAAGHLSAGDVDDRSIADVTAGDVRGYRHVHFFAGIGGWACALRLAGWDDSRRVWTGSCPCQPFSCAGKGRGFDDHRHLWPEFARLIGECRPPTVFGEQVASPAGREWLAGVRADLEVMGYAVGASDLCAAGVTAPHIRQRLYWVADARGQRHDGQPVCVCQRGPQPSVSEAAGSGDAGGMGDADDEGLEGWSGVPERTRECAPWASSGPIFCRDGKYRRIPAQREFFPLVAGLQPGRVGILRGAGNAIVPQVAAQFVGAFLDVEDSNA